MDQLQIAYHPLWIPPSEVHEPIRQPFGLILDGLGSLPWWLIAIIVKIRKNALKLKLFVTPSSCLSNHPPP
jgi:hypothetical protein